MNKYQIEEMADDMEFTVSAFISYLVAKESKEREK